MIQQINFVDLNTRPIYAKKQETALNFYGKQKIDSKQKMAQNAKDKNQGFLSNDIEKRQHLYETLKDSCKMLAGLFVMFASSIIGTNLANRCSSAEAKTYEQVIKMPCDSVKKVNITMFKPTLRVH